MFDLDKLIGGGISKISDIIKDVKLIQANVVDKLETCHLNFEVTFVYSIANYG
jgi:hypothetical protein